MNDPSKIKLLTATTLALILLNVVVVGFIWFGPRHQRPLRGGREAGPDRSEIIIHELKLDDAQRRQFEDMRDEHHHIMMSVNEKDRHTHEALFDLIKSGKDTSSAADSLINEIADHRKQIETLTYHHLADLRKICRPEQQKIFDDIVIALFNRGPEVPPPPKP